MPPKRCPANGHGLPSSRSACTERTPGIDCASRSTATTSSPRWANNFACRPAPLATSSTGPRVTSGAQRATHADGVSSEACIVFPQQLPQDRPVAALLVLAIAADRKIRVVRQLGEKLEQALGGRRLHLPPIPLHESLPVPVSASDELRARRQVRQPDIVEVEARIVRLLHAARRPPHGAKAQALAARARATETDYADHRFPAPPRAGWFPRIRWSRRSIRPPSARRACARRRDRSAACRRRTRRAPAAPASRRRRSCAA